jgi:hypothetical protein
MDRLGSLENFLLEGFRFDRCAGACSNSIKVVTKRRSRARAARSARAAGPAEGGTRLEGPDHRGCLAGQNCRESQPERSDIEAAAHPRSQPTARELHTNRDRIRLSLYCRCQQCPNERHDRGPSASRRCQQGQYRGFGGILRAMRGRGHLRDAAIAGLRLF